MIGVDDDVNRALFRALPGDTGASRTPDASASPGASASVEPSASANS
jgi:hypothetical protein